MIRLRPADSRGHAEHGWLDSWHTFSFGSYVDAAQMGYSDLRVINEDRVVPGAGFAPHGHQNMEIISYVLGGALGHQDSTGGGSTLRPGELQLMSAGHGIRHSEMNASVSAPVHFLQIWIIPDQTGTPPGYQQGPLDKAALRRGWTTVIAPQGAPFSIRQDARVDIAWPAAGTTLTRPLDPARRHYLQVARGAVQLGAQRLSAGDAAMIENETALSLRADSDAELLLFDLR